MPTFYCEAIYCVEATNRAFDLHVGSLSCTFHMKLFYFFFLDQNDYWELFTISCNLKIKRDFKRRWERGSDTGEERVRVLRTQAEVNKRPLSGLRHEQKTRTDLSWNSTLGRVYLPWHGDLQPYSFRICSKNVDFVVWDF